MSRIETQRLAEPLRRTFNLRGEGGPAELGPEVHAVLVMENDRPEWKYLGNEFLCAAPLLKAADAANLGVAGIVNAAGSNVLGIIDGVLINNENAATAAFNILRAGPTLGTLFRANPLDLRWLVPNAKRSALQVGSAVEAAITGGLLMRVSLQAGDSIWIPLQMVLPPTPPTTTSQIIVESAVINSIVSCNFVWRERQMEPGEDAGR